MKLIQFFLPGKGKRVGLVQGDRVLDVTSTEEGVRSTLDLVTQGKTAQGLVVRATWLARRLHRKGLDWRELQQPPSRRAPHLLIPIDAPEVWGAHATCPHAKPAGAIAADDRRPALFFKGTAARAVGPNAPIAIRQDSCLTVPEPGLAAVLGPDGGVVAFTICDDVTARDLALAQPGFLSQAKVYGGSIALGPCLVTPDELGDPHPLQVRCTILRGGETMFSEAVGTAGQPRRLAELAVWLGRDNPGVPGAVVFVGAGVEIPEAQALRNGDRVDIEAQGIGRLSNPVGR